MGLSELAKPQIDTKIISSQQFTINWDNQSKEQLVKSGFELSENDNLLIWNDVPEQGNRTIYFGNTGVRLCVGDWGKGIEWAHHFQPDGEKNYTPSKSFKYVRRYSKGVLFMIEWLSNKTMLESSISTFPEPKRIVGTTDRHMFNLGKRLFGDNLVLDEKYEVEKSSDYWYHLDISEFLKDNNFKARLVRYASR